MGSLRRSALSASRLWVSSFSSASSSRSLASSHWSQDTTSGKLITTSVKRRGGEESNPLIYRIHLCVLRCQLFR
jgi:hypothetical protein